MSDDPLIAAFFEEAEELLADFEAGLLQLEERPDDVELLNRIFRSAHTLKGNSAMLGFEAIAHFTHALEDLLDRLRKARLAVTPRVVDALLASKDVVRTLLARARAGGPTTDRENEASERVAGALTALVAEAPAALEERPVETAAQAVAEGRRHMPALVAAETASIRVPVEKVDRLLNLVGELVITQSMVAEAVARFSPERLAALRTAVALMDRHARELHERMMGVRMIPIRTLFARFPRLVRDLAASLGKSVVLEMSGEETELDRTVIEKVADTITHLVRNAVDHGLEAPDARRTAGKPEVGRLSLKASHQGGSIYIELADDGCGLDRDRILAKARALGLVGDESLTDDETFALIFRAGFSTADTITELSGRGVGMDVVRENIEALGGSIALASERTRGTTFRVKLPLTLAILDGQLLSMGGEIYVLPLVSIVESVRPRREQIHTVLGAGEMLAIRDRVLPVLRLHRILGVLAWSDDPVEGLFVIVEHEGRRAALLVDELLGQQQVVIKSLEAHFQKVRGVAGATILGDGRVTLILDVPGLLALADRLDGPWPPSDSAREAAAA